MKYFAEIKKDIKDWKSKVFVLVPKRQKIGKMAAALKLYLAFKIQG